MIQLAEEEVITFRDAAKMLPRRHGKRIHTSTLYRWARRGVRGVRLETIHVGGTVCTSAEALQRFCDRLSKDSQPTFSDSRLAKLRDAERKADELGL